VWTSDADLAAELPGDRGVSSVRQRAFLALGVHVSAGGLLQLGE